MPELEQTEGGEDNASEVAAAFHTAYRCIGVTAALVVEVAGQVTALAELLVAKGVLGLDEVDRARRPVEARQLDRLRDEGVTVHIAKSAPDKYEVEGPAINCADRAHLCRAACCRLRFSLSEQDVTENVVRWALHEPYLNRQRDNGWCAHNDEQTAGCSVYEQRPAVCRAYDCRTDGRIWLDFEGRVPNPDLVTATGPVGADAPAARPAHNG